MIKKSLSLVFYLCYVEQMTIKPNRYRKPLGTTVDPEIFRIISALSEPDRKGHFIDEVICQWLTNCAYFDMPKVGPVMLKNQGLYFAWVDMNNEEQSAPFKTMIDGLLWLRSKHPDANYILQV